jgi:hypothetical protein
VKNLKYALIFFFVVDISMFLASQVTPDMFVSLLPQFDIESTGNTYPRLVGLLFLMLGLTRLYGGLNIEEKGAVAVSIWSWVVELAYVTTEIFRGHFTFSENVVTFVLAPLMFAWSVSYYRKAFRQGVSGGEP